MIAAVVTYDNSCVLLVGEGFVDVVREALCGSAHDVTVHAVSAGAHDAAQTASAEFECLVEGIDEGCCVRVVEHGLDFGLGGVVIDR